MIHETDCCHNLRSENSKLDNKSAKSSDKFSKADFLDI